MRFFSVFLSAMLLIGLSNSCKQAGDKDFDVPADPKIAKLKLPAGFKAEHLYSPSENEQGSWVSMAFDDKGRLLASDQYGSIYRIEIPDAGTDSIRDNIKIEKLSFPDGDKSTVDSGKLTMGYAHGLLWAFNSLYVMVNHYGDENFSRGSGFYRLQDMDGDDQFDKMTLIKNLKGDGEHGPHSAILSPDNKHIYIIAGNFTAIPEMSSYKRLPNWEHDNLLPLIKDPNGHDNVVHTHGGWVARMDSVGAGWELVAAGFRNPFDLAFNDVGDLFTYDSDMEWDFGLPWYRPTRILHITSGSEFGWRPGTGKWPEYFPDNLPSVVDVGQGSPTSMFYGARAKFPEKYRRSMFAFDWSFGIIYSLDLKAEGASYTATGEEFLSGSPLPLTDGTIGPDGAMYFLTGGRRLESDLYRIYYAGDEETEAPLAPKEVPEENKIRRQLEKYHQSVSGEALDYIWKFLNHKDRHIRYAARVALEHQPIESWSLKAGEEKDPARLIEIAIAVARSGNSEMQKNVFSKLPALDFSALSQNQKLDFLRATELLLLRGKAIGADAKVSLAGMLQEHFPAKTNSLNRELSKLLVHLKDPSATGKTVALLQDAKDDEDKQETLMASTDLILRNPQYGLDIANMLARTPPLQQTYLATVLSEATQGWTSDLREKYFQWYSEAFTYKGGYSFNGFINNARKNALKNFGGDQVAYYNQLSGDSLVGRSGNSLIDAAMKAQGPGRAWKVDEAVAVADSGIYQRNFERGKAMFATSLCISCHIVRGEGGISGPDLTQLGNRFSYRDMLEAIIEPDKEISDQYGSTVFELKNGRSVLGRLVSEENDKYIISQNPFAPHVTRELEKKDVQRTRTSEVSPMLPGLINRLNSEELRDLLAFLKAGGNAEDSIFRKK